MCLLCQFWSVACVVVVSCTTQTDMMSTVTSLVGGVARRQHKAMRNVLRLLQVRGQLSPNCMLGPILEASALKQPLLACLSLAFVNCVRPGFCYGAACCSRDLASSSFASFCMSTCAGQIEVMSSVTSLAGGVG